MFTIHIDFIAENKPLTINQLTKIFKERIEEEYNLFNGENLIGKLYHHKTMDKAAEGRGVLQIFNQLTLFWKDLPKREEMLKGQENISERVLL